MLFSNFFFFQFRGFYRGLSWPLVSFGIVNSVFFGVYGNTLKFLESDKTKRKSNYLNIYLSGCVGGAAQLVFVVPVDYIKTALQSQIPHQTGVAKGSHSSNPVTRPWDIAFYEKGNVCVCAGGGGEGVFRA